ncbi:hypothetical protein HYH02_007686 [Chlamydomonas schloesseri]|uniref:SET domain-containing protein n=1 Tax=Chlamydomonas schloesseri TaxID=2026947 RepID=A0A835WH04_9CHLO|nr:hypothetical protein HYH02_007686 [Chlamydomonas schloesseri]|eukprot:KAG2447358.1 hypothetical protein HYH02_007686 [Chlamydomonas schloesseri]
MLQSLQGLKNRLGSSPHGRAQRRRLVCRAAAQAADSVTDELLAVLEAYTSLADAARVETSLELRRTGGALGAGLGLATTRPHAKNEVLMRVPRSAAIVLDYDRGLSMPPARWPRLRGGVSSSTDPLPWDILIALALVDGLAGDGGEFWSRYCDALLPAPERLTLPMCWEPQRLAHLQHRDIAAAAEAQQDRLMGLFPELMEPLAPDVPSWIQWAFACVRSRAFRAGPDAFAFVPFLDLANHADAPQAGPPPGPGGGAGAGAQAGPSVPPANHVANADFRASPPSSGSGEAAAGEYFELYALRDIEPGEEVTISYAGPKGYTNQRFMAQYGFVPVGGNAADRVQLELAPELQAAPLDLAVLQALLGDGLFLAALNGSDPYLNAALRSLPLADGGSGGEEGRTASAASVRTAQALLEQVEAQIAAGTTTLEADEALMGGPQGAALAAADPRQAAAVSYRIERKRLLGKAAAVLRAYARQ